MDNYHKLFDEENNMIMSLNTETENAISDVLNTCGYDLRGDIRRIIHDQYYLFEWEERLINESQKINKTKEALVILEKELNETKNKIDEEKKELDKELEKYRKDIFR